MHFVSQDGIEHLTPVSGGLFECWCCNKCCMNTDGECICPDCACQVKLSERPKTGDETK